MKKQVALLGCALMGTAFALGATACKPDTDSLYPQVEKQNTLTTMTLLTRDDDFGDFDAFGNTIVESETLDASKNPTAVVYRIFNASKNAFIADATVSIPVEVAPPTATALSYSTQFEIDKLTDGFYASIRVVMTREKVTDSWSGAEKETLYTLYGNNGKVATDVKGVFDEGVFYAEGGARYYLDLKGNLVKEDNIFAKIFTYDAYVHSEKVGDFYVEEDDGFYYVYDEEGKYVREVNGMYEMGIPDDAFDVETWTAGRCYFVQYSLELPDTAKDFDYIVDYRKYDLVTKSYDVKKDKVKDIEFAYVVDDMVYSFGDTCILEVYAIENQRILTTGLVQSFNEKGKVAVDLQDLAPGADEVNFTSDGKLELTSGETTYVYENGKLVYEYREIAGLGKLGNTFISEIENKIWLYKADGGLAKTYEKVVEADELDEEHIIIMLETSLVKYNVYTHAETTICTFEKDKAEMVAFEDLYFVMNFYGADGKQGTTDDTYTVYFLIDGMQNITLTAEQAEGFDGDMIDSYYRYEHDKFVRGVIFYTAQENAQGESIPTFYHYEQVIKY